MSLSEEPKARNKPAIWDWEKFGRYTFELRRKETADLLREVVASEEAVFSAMGVEWSIDIWPAAGIVAVDSLEQYKLIVTGTGCDGKAEQYAPGAIVLSTEAFSNTVATLYLDKPVKDAPIGPSLEDNLRRAVIEFWEALGRAYDRLQVAVLPVESESLRATKELTRELRGVRERLDTLQVGSIVLPSEAPDKTSTPSPPTTPLNESPEAAAVPASGEPQTTEAAGDTGTDDEALLARIPNETDRHIARLWRQHYTAREIGSKTISKKTGKTLKASTVTNIIYRLRRDYGEKVVPRDRDRHSRK